MGPDTKDTKPVMPKEGGGLKGGVSKKKLGRTIVEEVPTEQGKELPPAIRKDRPPALWGEVN